MNDVAVLCVAKNQKSLFHICIDVSFVVYFLYPQVFLPIFVNNPCCDLVHDIIH